MSDVRAIGDRTNNAELIRDCAALGYLTGTIFDATYGTGRFWKLWHPGSALITNDLDPETSALYHDDFRKLIWHDNEFATVVFDPPYKLNGTSTGIGPSASDDSYGVGGAYVTVAEKMDLIFDGITECARIASRYLLVKCQDQVVSGNVVWQTHMVTDWANSIGLALVDMLHVQGYRKQPEGRRQLHARRDYSTLLVFGTPLPDRNQMELAL